MSEWNQGNPPRNGFYQVRMGFGETFARAYWYEGLGGWFANMEDGAREAPRRLSSVLGWKDTRPITQSETNDPTTYGVMPVRFYC